MLILNKFTNEEIDTIAKQIHQLILEENNLTDRSLGYIKRVLRNSSFYVSTDRKGKVCGFIAKEKLIGDYYEIKCWYVVPESRGTGLANKLFLKSIDVSNNKYLSSTFEPRVVTKLENYNFKLIKMTDLPWDVMLVYIFTRHLSSIIKHLFLKRSYLLLKS